MHFEIFIFLYIYINMCVCTFNCIIGKINNNWFYLFFMIIYHYVTTTKIIIINYNKYFVYIKDIHITYPPRPVLCGATTVIQMVAAIAASIALPFFRNILVPICEQFV